uniref:ATP synthase F0 subunit 8 n=1 Tax=Metacrangonyx sp. 3 ssp. 1 MDMBR-2012 TaxID=1200666 RepID=K7ZVL5_9CRUS|nr:ATP synthase F0 subunit 8 [Metacrangonyx sp. 3 ssp. 1 MDMBR-2012]
MPQMAPSLWLAIYMVMCVMIIFLGGNLFFSSKSKVNFIKCGYSNKIMGLLWQ